MISKREAEQYNLTPFVLLDSEDIGATPSRRCDPGDRAPLTLQDLKERFCNDLTLFLFSTFIPCDQSQPPTSGACCLCGLGGSTGPMELSLVTLLPGLA